MKVPTAEDGTQEQLQKNSPRIMEDGTQGPQQTQISQRMEAGEDQ